MTCPHHITTRTERLEVGLPIKLLLVNALMHPFDVLALNRMTDSLISRKKEYRTMSADMRDIWQCKGLRRGFYRGLIPATLGQIIDNLTIRTNPVVGSEFNYVKQALLCL